jgi:hypothetical protein
MPLPQPAGGDVEYTFGRTLQVATIFIYGPAKRPHTILWSGQQAQKTIPSPEIGNVGAEENIMSKNGGIIGISDHGGWAVLVIAARDGTLLDRRRVELVDEDLPKLPHHHEGQGLPLDEAVALVERVRVSAERNAVLALDAVTMVVPHIRGVALRTCPPLPPTIAERITDYRARNVADWVMYRRALASAAEARGWPVHWYNAKKVLDEASLALHVDNLDAHFLQVRKAAGPPWDKDHKLAMAAAIVTAKA